MPTTVTKQIKVSELVQGDVFDSGGGTVATPIVRKQVWAHVTITHGAGVVETHRMRMDALVTVLRTVPTEEERRADMLSAVAHELRRQLRGWLKSNPADTIDAVVEKFRVNEYDGELFDSFKLGGVLEAQAMYKQALVLRRWIHVASDRRGATPGGEGVDVNEASDLDRVDDELILDAFAGWMYDDTTNRTSSLRNNPLSRSTSVLSNLLEDMDAYAVAKIRDDVIRWSGGHDELLRRVALLKAEAEAKRNRPYLANVPR